VVPGKKSGEEKESKKMKLEGKKRRGEEQEKSGKDSKGSRASKDSLIHHKDFRGRTPSQNMQLLSTKGVTRNPKVQENK